jgi:hypothetical protein
MSNSLEDFTFCINSTNYLERFTSLYDQTYLFNSDNIQPGKYKVTFSYRGGNDAVSTVNFSQYATIYVSFGSTQEIYQPSNTNNFRNTHCIGFTRNNPSGISTFCDADHVTNPPFYIDYSPSNIIRVTIRSGVTNNLYTGTADYLLFLQFSKC